MESSFSFSHFTASLAAGPWLLSSRHVWNPATPSPHYPSPNHHCLFLIGITAEAPNLSPCFFPFSPSVCSQHDTLRAHENFSAQIPSVASFQEQTQSPYSDTRGATSMPPSFPHCGSSGLPWGLAPMPHQVSAYLPPALLNTQPHPSAPCNSMGPSPHPNCLSHGITFPYIAHPFLFIICPLM